MPVLVGDPATILQRVRPTAGAPLTFRTEGLGRPRDVTLAPYHGVAHERYVLYWRVVPG